MLTGRLGNDACPDFGKAVRCSPGVDANARAVGTVGDLRPNAPREGALEEQVSRRLELSDRSNSSAIPFAETCRRAIDDSTKGAMPGFCAAEVPIPSRSCKLPSIETGLRTGRGTPIVWSRRHQGVSVQLIEYG